MSDFSPFDPSPPRNKHCNVLGETLVAEMDDSVRTANPAELAEGLLKIYVQIAHHRKALRAFEWLFERMVKASAKDQARFKEAIVCMAMDDLTQLAESIFTSADSSHEH